jgi:hypothetical protein
MVSGTPGAATLIRGVPAWPRRAIRCRPSDHGDGGDYADQSGRTLSCRRACRAPFRCRSDEWHVSWSWGNRTVVGLISLCLLSGLTRASRMISLIEVCQALARASTTARSGSRRTGTTSAGARARSPRPERGVRGVWGPRAGVTGTEQHRLPRFAARRQALVVGRVRGCGYLVRCSRMSVAHPGQALVESARATSCGRLRG